MARLSRHEFNFDHRGKNYRASAIQTDKSWVGWVENVNGINCQEKTAGALVNSFKECLDLMYGNEHMAENFTHQVQGAIRVDPTEGGKEFNVNIPFHFYNGEPITIVIRDEGERWVLTDKGQTRKYLSRFNDNETMASDSYKQVFDRACLMYGIESVDGELVREIQTINCVDPFYDFVKGLLQILHVIRYKEEEKERQENDYIPSNAIQHTAVKC